uniref:Uncharacterized protein n=1 Tax=Lactuca sativa TaxID=4236 RepID=A0A9R1UFR8_LACSA|nr:hypothetical protein LSAT_V11C900462640 [Lactuca sativa]
MFDKLITFEVLIQEKSTFMKSQEILTFLTFWKSSFELLKAKLNTPNYLEFLFTGIILKVYKGEENGEIRYFLIMRIYVSFFGNDKAQGNKANDFA